MVGYLPVGRSWFAGLQPRLSVAKSCPRMDANGVQVTIRGPCDLRQFALLVVPAT